MIRKTHLRDCDPHWVSHDGACRTGVSFECPESDGGCDGRHVIPGMINGPGPTWGITGELPDITINPSIRCGGACRMHIEISNGSISFCDDSKSGPDWDPK